MPCSNCGIIGHNILTCGRYNNTMPQSSSYYNDYKQVVNNNYSYAKKKKQETFRSGAVFKKTKNPYGNIKFAKTTENKSSYI